ncbi:MAG: hypothetical protein ACK4R6_07750 [Spirosomataceae bacterium]
MNHVTQLACTPFGEITQNDVTNCIDVIFGDVHVHFKIHNFLNFKDLVDKVDIHAMIFNLTDAFDYEFISAPNANKTLKLTLCELLHLRELLAQASFSLYVYQTLFAILGDFLVTDNGFTAHKLD